MTTHTADTGTQAIHSPTLDSQVIRVLTGDTDCSPRDWLLVIDRRPALRQRLLQTINNCQKAVPRPVVSVSQAIVLLGFNTVRNLARTLMG